MKENPAGPKKGVETRSQQNCANNTKMSEKHTDVGPGNNCRERTPRRIQSKKKRENPHPGRINGKLGEKTPLERFPKK